MDPAAFDALVDRALDQIPDELAALVRNVVVLVEQEPPEGEPDDLLGLYEGVALTDRWGTPAMELPDRILIFRGPLLDLCDSEAELVEDGAWAAAALNVVVSLAVGLAACALAWWVVAAL